MQKKFKIFKTLRGKLLFQNGVLVLVALVLATTIISYLMVDRLQEMEFQNNETYLRHTQLSIDTTLKNMAQVTMFCYSDSEVQSIMMNYSGYGETLQNEKRDYLYNLIQSLMYLKSEIEAVYLFDTENLIYGFDVSRATQISLVEMVEEPWYEALGDPTANRISNCVLIGAHQPEFLSRRGFQKPPDYTYFAIAREIKSFKPHVTIGYMLIISPVRNLQQLIERNAEQDATIYLVDDSGLIISDGDGQQLGIHLDEAAPGLLELVNTADVNHSYRLNELEYLVSSHRSEYSGWTLITMRPADIVYRETRLQLYINCAICILVLIFSFIVMNVIIKRSLGSLKALSQGMLNAIHRDFRADVEVSSEDEISKLSILFNQMMDTINTLIYSEYEATIQMQHLQLKQKQYQLDMLRNQINPHFLYNTLDTLRMKALINGDNEVADMAYNLADFFRRSVSKETEMVSVETEIEFAHLYFRLMQMRYRKLTFETQLDEDLLEEKVPNFILQPIMENCMLHGLKECKYNGVITLSLYTADTKDDFYIDIKDNGIGMDEAEVARLNAFLEQINDDMKISNIQNMGIDNVQRRLIQYYPAGYGIRIISQKGSGTTVRIKFQRKRRG